MHYEQLCKACEALSFVSKRSDLPKDYHQRGCNKYKLQSICTQLPFVCFLVSVSPGLSYGRLTLLMEPQERPFRITAARHERNLMNLAVSKLSAASAAKAWGVS